MVQWVWCSDQVMLTLYLSFYDCTQIQRAQENLSSKKRTRQKRLFHCLTRVSATSSSAAANLPGRVRHYCCSFSENEFAIEDLRQRTWLPRASLHSETYLSHHSPHWMHVWIFVPAQVEFEHLQNPVSVSVSVPRSYKCFTLVENAACWPGQGAQSTPDQVLHLLETSIQQNAVLEQIAQGLQVTTLELSRLQQREGEHVPLPDPWKEPQRLLTKLSPLWWCRSSPPNIHKNSGEGGLPLQEWSLALIPLLTGKA